MKDMDKTKKQLLDEIADLHQKSKDFKNCPSQRPEIIHPLKRSEALFRLLVEQANEAFLVIQDGKIRYANAKASEITGFSSKQLYARPFLNLIHPADRNRFSFDDIQNRNPAGTSEPFTCRITAKNNDIRWL